MWWRGEKGGGGGEEEEEGNLGVHMAVGKDDMTTTLLVGGASMADVIGLGKKRGE